MDKLLKALRTFLMDSQKNCNERMTNEDDKDYYDGFKEGYTDCINHIKYFLNEMEKSKEI